MLNLISPAEAEAIVLAHVPKLATEKIALERASGRVLAVELAADRPLPPYHRVMMDGICFRSADAGNEPVLAIAGVHAAGDPEPAPLPARHCWEVMTGASLPPDCDTVVPYEQITRPDDRHAAFARGEVQPGRYVHRAGSDFAAGELLVPRFMRVDSRVAAVAATIGATTLEVLQRPRVSLFTTGDEVIAPEESPAPHQVRLSNAPALRAALHRLGAELVHAVHLPDDQAASTAALGACPASDVILLCGGISKGKYDFVRPSVEALHGEPAFHGIAQRPGKPLAFWPGPPAVFALPGNPMSVLVCFHRYVWPLLEAMQRQARPVRHAELAAPFRFDPPLACFLPVRLHHDGARLIAEPRPLANSGDFASSIDSAGFVELPAGPRDFPEGFLAPFREWL